MLFNSLVFILFFMIVCLFHFNFKQTKSQNIFILGASYLFYSAWNPLYLLLLIFSSFLDWIIAGKIDSNDSERKRKLFLLASFVINLSLLFFFKASDFFLGIFNMLFTHQFELSQIDEVIFPIGISFYTFQTIGYSFDVYRKEIKPQKNFLDYATYVAFFPQLIAGPILKSTQFIPQTQFLKKFDPNRFCWGLYLITLGLFQKLIISDTFLEEPVSKVFDSVGVNLSWMDSWIGSMAFGTQIFFDFSGYSTCAIGIALCLGFMIPNNFHAPFAAVGYLDLWRRWQISFWAWTRSYIYIPLGGNKKGLPRFMISVFLIFTFSGLWHGVGWNFLLWGLANAVFSLIEIIIRKLYPNLFKSKKSAVIWMLKIITLILYTSTAPFFRSPNIDKTADLFLVMIGYQSGGFDILTYKMIFQIMIVYIPMLVFHWYIYNKTFEEFVEKLSPVFIISSWVIMIISISLYQGTSNAFAYFQF